MSAHITSGTGKIYKVGNKQAITTVKYQLHEEFTEGGSLERWWGELTFMEKVNIDNSDRYTIELDDKRKGRCSLRRRTNKAVLGVPPRFFYLFQGGSSLE